MRGVIEAGVTLPMLLTRALLPLLGTDLKRCGPPGRVVYVTSVLGVASMPFMAPSCAAQAGLEGLAHALRRELRPYGIKVARACAQPGVAPLLLLRFPTPFCLVSSSAVLCWALS